MFEFHGNYFMCFNLTARYGDNRDTHWYWVTLSQHPTQETVTHVLMIKQFSFVTISKISENIIAFSSVLKIWCYCADFGKKWKLDFAFNNLSFVVGAPQISQKSMMSCFMPGHCISRMSAKRRFFHPSRDHKTRIAWSLILPKVAQACYKCWQQKVTPWQADRRWCQRCTCSLRVLIDPPRFSHIGTKTDESKARLPINTCNKY